jgi:hypothetical protein
MGSWKGESTSKHNEERSIESDPRGVFNDRFDFNSFGLWHRFRSIYRDLRRTDMFGTRAHSDEPSG